MKKITIILIAVTLAMVFGSCTHNKLQPVSKTGFHLNTIIKITVYGENGEKALNAAFDELMRLENLLSKNIARSDIQMINAAAGKAMVSISAETQKLLELSIRYHMLSKQYFDITIGPLVDLWQIGNEEAAVPNAVALRKAMNLLGMDNLLLKSGSAGLSKSGMAVDIGGIAKGFIADKIGVVLKREKCSGAIINLGGNVLTIGEKPDGSLWKVGIQDPFQSTGTYIEVVSGAEMSVVTAGPYERYFEENGVVYHHILNPFTGYPVANNIASVTIISENSVDGDALSTSVFALGKDEGIALIETLDNTECYIIMSDGTIIMSEGFSKYLLK